MRAQGERMGRTMRRIAAVPCSVALLLAACSGGGGVAEDAPPILGTEVASGSGGGYAVRLLASGPLQVGLNPLAVELETVGGAPVTDAAVELLPLMTMGAESHRCPVIGPSAAGPDGRYGFHAVFQMATGMGTWSAEVAVTRSGTTVVVPLSDLSVVAGKDLAKSFVAGASRYVMALEFGSAPTVGLNPIVVTLHETQDLGMTFAPVSDATLVLDPQMPSMGHGSPGSVDPTLAAPGWYEGQLSFSMTGEWVTTITARRGAELLGAPEFIVWF
jgi:hypothetical protein